MDKHQFPSDNIFDYRHSEQYEDLHQDLVTTISLVYAPCDLKPSRFLKEAESEEYGAYAFQLSGSFVRFRVAKTTPTKAGQFVAIWKRAGNGSTQPYAIEDPIDFFVICTRKDNLFGQFVFPKFVLSKHNVISTNGEGGKRGIRVYPPWEKSLNRQAQKTQSWQIKYFLDIPQGKTINCDRVKWLYLS